VETLRSSRFRRLAFLALRDPLVLLTAAASVVGSPSAANTITFETAALGTGFTGPITEDGFTYSSSSGALLINAFGNPAHDAEGNALSGGGVLKIVSASNDDFNFGALDFSAFDLSGTGSQTLKVEGFFDGSSVGVDQYTLANTSVFNPRYDNWTSEAASVLAGKSLSELDITLNASISGSGSLFNESVDNVALTPVPAAVPEASSLALLGVAVAAMCFGRVRRRRRSPA
jgi:hypothetical protein